MSEDVGGTPRGDADDLEDINARFERIVAGWDVDTPTSASANPQPNSPTGIPGVPEFTQSEPPIRPRPESAPTEPHEPLESIEDPLDSGWRSYSPVEAEDHFEPPKPELPAVHDATFWLGLGGVVIGPLLVLWAALFSGNPDPGWWVLLGILAAVAGFGLIVLRGSGERDPDDDGARV